MQESVFARLEERAAQVDLTIANALEEHLASAIRLPFSILAVGGYGRRELFPHSDIDLIILLDQEPEEQLLAEPLGRFLQGFWDTKAAVSHSVRTVEECLRFHPDNVHLHISLLDARLVAGEHALFKKLHVRLPDFYARYGRELSQRLAAQTRVRHAKFNDTVYSLEPDIKDGPGGLRDIHFLRWLKNLNATDAALREAAGFYGPAHCFLAEIRYFLHERAGRDSNVLSFELQDEAAATLPGSPMPPEDWMRDYYRHARGVFRSACQVLELYSRIPKGRLRNWLNRSKNIVTPDFAVSENSVSLRNPAATLASIDGLFELFTFVANHRLALSWDTRKSISEQVSEWRATRVPMRTNWSEWHKLLSPAHVAPALREMQTTGVLAVAVPNWSDIESLVVRDFYHRYTVDEHTLVALDTVDRLLTEEKGPSARFGDLAREQHDLSQLRMALLLHDIGKGVTPGEHVRGSIETARTLLLEFGVPDTERRSIEFLIENHLELSSIMTSRDLSDESTARYLTERTGTVEDLARLTLLTYADISAVNPTAMSPWRLEQLWRIYSVAAAQFTRELVSDRIPHDFRLSPQTRPGLAEYLEGFPTRYLRIHSQAQIESHYDLAQARRRGGLAVEIHREPAAWLMTVVGEDAPGLFAALCGTLASFGMNILQAEAAANAAGCVLDEFCFEDTLGTLELNPEEVERLRSTVEDVARGKLNVTDLLRRRKPLGRRPANSPVPNSVHFDNDASDHSTLLHFSGEDRPGLLFELASVLKSGDCDIELVLVHTEAHRALDVIYLTKDGSKLDTATQQELERKLMPTG